MRDKLLFKFKQFESKMFDFLNRHKSSKIAILSDNKNSNKIKDDIYLKLALSKMGIRCHILSWKKFNNFKDYDAVIFRSTWDYHNKLDEFNMWLEQLSKSGIKVFNNINLVKENMNKYKQYQLFEQYKIPCIKTQFVEMKNFTPDLFMTLNNNSVIKPIISGSSDNVYLYSEKTSQNEILEMINNLNAVSNSDNDMVMIQPFIKDFDNGEISVIYINGVYSHAVVRHNDPFKNNKRVVVELEYLNDEIRRAVNRVLKIEEYRDSVYMRIDFVKTEGKYLVNEIELFEPTLFFYVLKDKKKFIKNFAIAIQNKL